MNEYENKANYFLKKVGATIKVEFFANMPYFDDDKEKRDVYEITLSRNGKEYKFKFGQSLASSGNMVKRNPHGKTVYDHEMVRRVGGRIKPTAYDVLACIQKYDVGTFDNFCSEFGYNTDSRKAEKTYFAVQKEYDNIRKLFGDVMDELLEIQ